ncbi:MAG TPA: hypothetical protein VKI44_05325 [Acetobacteraceae bacterium]|nr:hypothetical protein [Acetobacteraceae bacterium]
MKRGREPSWSATVFRLPTILAGLATLFLLCVTSYAFYFLGGFNADRVGFEKMGAVGSLITGFGGSAALIWMAATFVLQMRELSLQRRELALQREAHQNKALMDFHLIAVDSMASICRELLFVIRDSSEFVSNPIRLDQLDLLYAYGKKDVYFLEVLERRDVQDFISKGLSQPLSRDIYGYYLVRLGSQLRKSSEVASSISDEHKLSDFIRDSNIVKTLDSALKKIAASQGVDS